MRPSIIENIHHVYHITTVKHAYSHFLFLLGCAKHELKYPRSNKISMLVGGSRSILNQFTTNIMCLNKTCVRYIYQAAPYRVCDQTRPIIFTTFSLIGVCVPHQF